MKYKSVLVVAILIISLTSTVYSKNIILKYGGKKGELSVYKLNLKGITTTTVGGRVEKLEVDTSLFLSQVIESISDSEIKIKTTVDSGTSNVNGKPSIPDVVGKTFYITSTRSGKVLKVEGIPNAVNLDQMQVMLPGEPISIGKTWSKEITVNTPVPIILKVTYKFKGFETLKGIQCAVIKSSVKSKKPDKNLDMSINANGLIYFDYQKGKIVKSVVTSFMRMSMRAKLYGPKSKLQKILTSMFMTLTMELQ